MIQVDGRLEGRLIDVARELREIAQQTRSQDSALFLQSTAERDAEPLLGVIHFAPHRAVDQSRIKRKHLIVDKLIYLNKSAQPAACGTAPDAGIALYRLRERCDNAFGGR